MKKKLLFIFALLLIPFSVFAKDYNEFDIRYEQKIGENVKNTEIKVYAKVGEETEFKDYTSEMTLEDVKWYKYKSSVEEGKTIEDYDYTDEELNIYGYLVNDEDVFEEDYGYFLMISRLYAQEEDTFARNVKINGIDVEELKGTCYNTGNEFFIKTISNGNHAIQEKEEIEVIDNEKEESPVEPKEVDEIKTCMLGLSLCCTTFLGLSLCIWIIIAIILLIVIFCLIKLKKRKEN